MNFSSELQLCLICFTKKLAISVPLLIFVSIFLVLHLFAFILAIVATALAGMEQSLTVSFATTVLYNGSPQVLNGTWYSVGGGVVCIYMVTVLWGVFFWF